MKSHHWSRAACLAAIGLLIVLAASSCGRPPQAAATDPGSSKLFGGAQVQEIFRLRLDRDDLVLESVQDAIRQHDIQDGAVLTALGSVQDCTYHNVKSLAPTAEQQYTTVKGPTEILNANGIIAAGEPHLHVTLSDLTRGAFGGHLEKGCRVLYRAELTIAKFSGLPLARKLNKEGTPLLQPK
ncbi:MAG: PPC domain-containing DNA-binding protein [Bryobacteraceae bacterium]